MAALLAGAFAANTTQPVIGIHMKGQCDGRVLGKMGHAERVGAALYKNVDGCYNMKLFESARKYFDI